MNERVYRFGYKTGYKIGMLIGNLMPVFVARWYAKRMLR